MIVLLEMLPVIVSAISMFISFIFQDINSIIFTGFIFVGCVLISTRK